MAKMVIILTALVVVYVVTWLWLFHNLRGRAIRNNGQRTQAEVMGRKKLPGNHYFHKVAFEKNGVQYIFDSLYSVPYSLVEGQRMDILYTPAQKKFIPAGEEDHPKSYSYFKIFFVPLVGTLMMWVLLLWYIN